MVARYATRESRMVGRDRRTHRDEIERATGEDKATADGFRFGHRRKMCVGDITNIDNSKPRCGHDRQPTLHHRLDKAQRRSVFA